MLMPCFSPVTGGGGTASHAWQVSTATFSQSFSVSAKTTDVEGITFNSTGTVMYVVGASGYVHSYTLSTGFNISTASFTATYNATAQSTALRDVQFNDDGTKMYLVGSGYVYQYTLSGAYDLSTASYASKSFNFATQDTEPSGVFFKTDGTVMFMSGKNNKTFYQYSLSTPWDVSTASYTSLSAVFAGNTLNGMFIGNSGSKLYGAREDTIAPVADTKVYEYDMNTTWSLTSGITYIGAVDVAAKEEDLKGVTFSPDGLKFYIVGPWSDSVHQYNC